MTFITLLTPYPTSTTDTTYDYDLQKRGTPLLTLIDLDNLMTQQPTAITDTMYDNDLQKRGKPSPSSRHNTKFGMHLQRRKTKQFVVILSLTLLQY